jgi:hypothetical protein
MPQLRPLALLFGALLLAAGPLAAEPLAREDVPEPLRPWVDWVLRGHEAETCPFLHAQDERACVWPGRLELALDGAGGRFVQQLFVAAESDVFLPGSAEAWPEEVSVGAAAAPVFERDGRPALRLAHGVHSVSGRFVWSGLPPLLAIPAETGLVSLRLDGAPIAAPRRDAAGRLWLRDAEAQPEAREDDRIDVQVHRLAVDEIPFALETRISLRVSGAAREERLGRALPEGFVPTALDGPLPARLDPDGRLRVQVRPGEWVLTLRARASAPVSAVSPPAQSEGARWDPSEVLSFAARPALRLVELEGAPPVDPTQTELPGEWRSLPAHRLEAGEALRFVEKRRGSEGLAADRLSLERTWHLDFDGGGATVADQLSGELRSATRLEMGIATALGRAAVNGVDQPVTKRPELTLLGVELPLGPVSVDSDSRVEGGARRLPAVGWNADVDSLAATLELPPGWRLLHVSGADHAEPTWIASWDTLDAFLVSLIAMATLRLFGAAAAGLALAALVLSYTEPAAPRGTWLLVLAAEALRRAVPAGRLARAVGWLRLGGYAALLLVALPFAVAQLRAGLFPALERPWQAAVAPRAEADDATAAGLADAETAEEMRVMEMETAGAAKSVPLTPEMASQLRALGYQSQSYRNVYAADPEARVQTGPGRPDWRWQRVTLGWSGPVARDQELRLWLLPPWLAGALAVLRVALLAAFVLLLLGRLPRRQRWGASPVIGRAVGLALALGVGFAPAPAHAELPTPELLEELRARLLERPSCAPHCATSPRLALSVSPERLELRLAVDAAAESAVPLPSADAAGFVPDLVVVDGRPAEALRRDAAGQLWLRVTAGSHVIALAGALPARANVEIPLPLRPQRVELVGAPHGWTVVGIDEGGRVSGALQLVRDAAEPAPDADGTPGGRALEPTAIPPFVQVVRTLALGLAWQVTTEVIRVAPPDGAIVLEVPLLAGESVTTAGVRVESGRALVALAPGAPSAVFRSQLTVSKALALEAPRDVAWTEVWRLDPSPLWHVGADGIPAIDALSAGTRLREWRPWPGEKLALVIERPEGAGGGTLTIDRSELSLSPGLRATDATLALALRSSQGGQHFVTLPEGAELTGMTLDGAEQPLRQEGRRVPIPLAPGAHEATLAWREPSGVRTWLQATPVELGAPSVNAHIELHVPAGRWVLFAGGPRLGPSVLFWSILLVVAALAVALGRIPWTPLRTRHWLGLGVGLTQAPLPAAALVVVWLLALGWRGRQGEATRTRSPLAFDALQVTLVLLTLAGLGALFSAVQLGLLGSPVMQIAGNGSWPELLRWYQDRTDGALPRPWLLSLSIWIYRLAMFAWSTWVAVMLVGWLRWGWRQWTHGGYWLRPRPRTTPPPLDPPLPQTR